MDRRSLLRAAGATLAGGAVPAVSTARATPDSAPAVQATQDPFVPRSRLPLEGAKEAVVGADGRTAYVATTDGFATVDVSDPDAPQVLAERRDLLADREGGPIELLQDVAVDGDRLAVAGPAHGPTFGGLLLYDVSDPAEPRRVAFHETDWPVHNCDLVDGMAYLTANDLSDRPVALVDVRDDEPEAVGRWSLLDHDEAWSDVSLGLRTMHDVTVADGVAYCSYWDAGTWLLDVSDPASPAYLGHVGGRTPTELLELPHSEQGLQSVEPPGNAHSAAVSDDGTVLAVGNESWDARRGDGHGGPSGIDLWDVTDPSTPEKLASIDPLVPRDATVEGTWTTAHNFELTGGRLYSSWYQDGVKVHDVSDPGRPELLAHWRDPDEARFWTAQLGRPGEFFVAADMGSRGSDGADAAVYCFPDRAGSQPDQPPIETPTPTPSPDSSTTMPGTASPDSPAGTVTETTTPDSPTDPATPTTAPNRTDTAGPSTETTTDGFGPLAALGGLGVAAWRMLRRPD